jgi:hypothetical protein
VRCWASYAIPIHLTNLSVTVDLPDRRQAGDIGISDLGVSALGPKAAVPRQRGKWLTRVAHKGGNPALGDQTGIEAASLA